MCELRLQSWAFVLLRGHQKKGIIGPSNEYPDCLKIQGQDPEKLDVNPLDSCILVGHFAQNRYRSLGCFDLPLLSVKTS